MIILIYCPGATPTNRLQLGLLQTSAMAILSFIGLLFLGCSLSEPTANSPSTPLRLGMLDNSKHQIIDACGCIYYIPGRAPSATDKSSHRYLFASKADQAWISLNGQVHPLSKTKDEIKYQGNSPSSFRQEFKSEDLTVTSSCNKQTVNSRSAETYSAKLQIQKGSQRLQVTAEASCGC